MTTTINEAIEKGDTVLICDGMMTGTIGVVGGRKGTSVAVCIQGINGHDCDGMCPSGGTFEPDYALLRFNTRDVQAANLIASHLNNDATLAAAEEREACAEAVQLIKNITIRELEGRGVLDGAPHDVWVAGVNDAIKAIRARGQGNEKTV